MALTNDQITAQNFKDFYGQIRPYLNGTAHGGFTPIGTVISVMGKQAPHNYLVCDGTVYNIADYPELAAYFVGQFEASNFFGGDGITTFAVPDLRGEFLRGSGTNGHTNQGSGAEVGVHQNSTEIPNITTSNNGQAHLAGYASASVKPQVRNGDITTSTGTKWSSAAASIVSESASRAVTYGIRPTNTSVLYCIATKNIFMDAGCNYSTDEQVVGTWINGKPLYQRTFSSTLHSTSGTIKDIDVSNIPIEDVAEIYGVIKSSNTPTYRPISCVYDANSYTKGTDIWLNVGSALRMRTNIDMGKPIFITVRYTRTTD